MTYYYVHLVFCHKMLISVAHVTEEHFFIHLAAEITTGNHLLVKID